MCQLTVKKIQLCSKQVVIVLFSSSLRIVPYDGDHFAVIFCWIVSQLSCCYWTVTLPVVVVGCEAIWILLQASLNIYTHMLHVCHVSAHSVNQHNIQRSSMVRYTAGTVSEIQHEYDSNHVTITNIDKRETNSNLDKLLVWQNVLYFRYKSFINHSIITGTHKV